MLTLFLLTVLIYHRCFRRYDADPEPELGLLGAVCSFFLEWGLYEAIRGAIASSGQLSFLHVVSFSTVALPVALVCVVTGLLIGVVGSLMSIRKFLKV